MYTYSFLTDLEIILQEEKECRIIFSVSAILFLKLSEAFADVPSVAACLSETEQAEDQHEDRDYSASLQIFTLAILSSAPYHKNKQVRVFCCRDWPASKG